MALELGGQLGLEPVGLFAVKGGERLVQLSDSQTWISIRDHMTRVRLVASQLMESAGLISGMHVLVVGAGVAGVSFALYAASRGVSVTLVEKEDGPLRRQLGCSTRYLHPHEYDWPRQSYRLDNFPGEITQNLEMAWSRPP